MTNLLLCHAAAHLLQSLESDSTQQPTQLLREPNIWAHRSFAPNLPNPGSGVCLWQSVVPYKILLVLTSKDGKSGKQISKFA